MRSSTILAAVLSSLAAAVPQGPPVGVAPDAKAPEGCESTSKSNFTIGYNLLSSMKRESAVEAQNNALECNLKDGVLRDPQDRIGSVVANRQFQFDGPPQAGAIYTGGFSVCKNSSLAIGGTTRWWKCGSGGFYNLYDEWIGGQCDEIRIVVTYKGNTDSASSSSSSAASASATGSSSSSSEGASSTSASGSASATDSASSSSSASGSEASATPSSSASAPGNTNAQASSDGQPPAPSAANAAPTRIPRRETFGAVVGIVGAALLL